MKTNSGCVYLIPSSLGEGSNNWISVETKQLISGLNFFIVENERSARRYLRSIGYQKNFDDVVLQKTERDEDFIGDENLLQHLQSGKNIGVLSEAGCPGVADPGSAIVRWAHENNFGVKPSVGPSSIVLALMASGLNGQQFAFHGYLPVNSSERKKKLKQLEEESWRRKQTQIFMETPYRNEAMVKDILETSKASTLLCIACSLTLESEFISTKKIADWKKNKNSFGKQPCIFLILAQ